MLSAAFNDFTWEEVNNILCRRALLQFYYNLFTLGPIVLTGKNGGDIINLNSG